MFLEMESKHISKQLTSLLISSSTVLLCSVFINKEIAMIFSTISLLMTLTLIQCHHDTTLIRVDKITHINFMRRMCFMSLFCILVSSLSIIQPLNSNNILYNISIFSFGLIVLLIRFPYPYL